MAPTPSAGGGRAGDGGAPLSLSFDDLASFLRRVEGGLGQGVLTVPSPEPRPVGAKVSLRVILPPDGAAIALSARVEARKGSRLALRAEGSADVALGDIRRRAALVRDLQERLPVFDRDYPARQVREGDRREVRLTFESAGLFLTEYLRTASRGGLILAVDRSPPPGAEVLVVWDAPAVFASPLEMPARVAMVRPEWLGLTLDIKSDAFVEGLLPAVTLAAEVHRAWGHKLTLRTPPAAPGARRSAARVATQLTYGGAWFEDPASGDGLTVPGAMGAMGVLPPEAQAAATGPGGAAPAAAHFWGIAEPQEVDDWGGWWGEGEHGAQGAPAPEDQPDTAAGPGPGAPAIPLTPEPPPSVEAWRDDVFGGGAGAKPGRRPARPTASELPSVASSAAAVTQTPLPLAPDDPLRAGDLAATPAGLVLVEIWRQHRSGRLTLRRRDRRVEVDLRRGMVVSITLPSRRGGRIGDILVARGDVGRGTADAAAADAARSGQLTGEALVARGAVAPETLGRALGAQLSARLEILSAIDDGSFTFDEGVAPARQALQVGASPGVEVTAALARRFARRTLLQMHDHDAPYQGAVAVVSAGSEGFIEHAGLETAGAGALLALIQGGASTVPALYRATSLSPRLAHAWTHALHQVGLVDLIPPA